MEPIFHCMANVVVRLSLMLLTPKTDANEMESNYGKVVCIRRLPYLEHE